MTTPTDTNALARLAAVLDEHEQVVVRAARYRMEGVLDQHPAAGALLALADAIREELLHIVGSVSTGEQQ